jgi:hypothetical protein
MISGQCLCGAHRFEIEGALEIQHHCHCGYCRKHHGTAFATVVGAPRDRFRWEQGEMIEYESSPGLWRKSCATCGTPLPIDTEGLPMLVPAGCLDEFSDPILVHIFVASKAPWYEIGDNLPAFDAYPPGVDAPAQETLPPLDAAGAPRGRCLCGDVRYVVEGEPIAARHCHCTRCRRARGAAHASNLVLHSDGVRFTAGEDSIRRYKLPEAKHFTQCFCGRCGGKVPMVDSTRQIVVVPLGGLDDMPTLLPQEHIWAADVPSWSGIFDDLPQRQGPPE